MAFEAITYYGLNEGGLDVARLGGFVDPVGARRSACCSPGPGASGASSGTATTSCCCSACCCCSRCSRSSSPRAGRGCPYALPLAAVGMLVTVLLDAGVAMVMTALIAVLAAAVNGTGLELGAYVLFGGIAGIVTVRRGERLTVFLQAGFAVFVVSALVVITFALLGNQDALGLLQLLGSSAIAAGGAAIATVGSFAVIGSVFGILTSFQLLELANPSQPLLRRLLVETPGTYHHSLMVGNLAERAAEAIGGDPLLARVAAYYHDIGKLSNPAAFIENQAGGENLHDELDPRRPRRCSRATSARASTSPTSRACPRR